MTTSQLADSACVPWAVARDARLHATSRLVYGVLRSLAGDANECYPTNGQVAQLVAKDPATIKRSIAELAEAGLIRAERAAWTTENPTFRLITFTAAEGSKRAS
jgi:hypothetical protein